MNIDNAKSYATEKNLVKALETLGFITHRHIVVRNRAGRYTAIFPASNYMNGYIGMYAEAGFMTIG